MSENQRPYPPRKKNAMDNWNLRLGAPKLKNGDRRPSLAPVLSSQGVSINVYTNDPHDKDGGIIRAPLGYFDLSSLLIEIGKLPEAPPGHKFSIGCKDSPRPQPGERRQPPVEISRVHIGKDSEGVCFISVISSDETRPKIKFDLLLGYKHVAYDANGNIMSKSEASAIFARGYARLMADVLASTMVDAYTPPQPSTNQSGYQNRNNQQRPQQSQQKPQGGASVDFDTPAKSGSDDWSGTDDIPL